MPKFHPVGIDLGTTYSVVARLDENGKTQIVRNSHGDILTPSVVLFEDSEIVVGREAKKAASEEADRVAECVKRDMGSEFYSKTIRGEQMPPEVIQACILRALAADARRACGSSFKAVITVPAYFDEPRRKATADAGEMAGLDVLDIVNEPTAAALSFGEHLGYLDPKCAPKGDMKVLVYDLGGGTFDVTVIELRPGHIRTLATDGDVRLGGRDWDERLANYLADQFQAQFDHDPRISASSQTRLMHVVEELKHTLSARTVANVHLECAGKSLDTTITREKFEELTEDLLERTAHTSREVLKAAGTSWQYISFVLLVGGSTRMPMVSRMLEQATNGMKPEHIVNPDEAVARGAAIYAGYLMATRGTNVKTSDASPGNRDLAEPDFRVTDVNSHSLGIEAIDPLTFRKENMVLIPRNTPLPCKVQEKFVTQKPEQQSVVIQVLEGESKTPAQCNPIARAVLKHLPGNIPQGYPIDVTYQYGTNGRLSVRAKMPATTQELRIELEREHSMSDKRVARWKQVFATNRGFNSFEEALEEVLQVEGLGEFSAQQTAPAKTTMPSAKMPSAAEPTYAVTTFQSLQHMDAQPTGAFAFPEAAPYARKNSTRRLLINVAGHVVASLIGLSVGYYILCWMEPSANFLQLRLPGLSAGAPSAMPETQ